MTTEEKEELIKLLIKSFWNTLENEGVHFLNDQEGERVYELIEKYKSEPLKEEKKKPFTIPTNTPEYKGGIIASNGKQNPEFETKG